MRQPTAEIFLKDVANHKMTVLLDQGIYRHLSFRQPGNSWYMWFDLVTWKGNLVIRGDMGTWVFNRVDDMFTFFRLREGQALSINASYWSEKIQNGVNGGRDSARRFDLEHFAEQLVEGLINYDLSDPEVALVAEAIREEIKECENHQMAAMEFAREFEYRFRDDREREPFTFSCDGIPDGMDYSYHFIWCLYAIVWGIQQWDASRAPNEPPIGVPCESR